MIYTKTTKTISCEHSGCSARITMKTDRDTPLRAEAKSKGWSRARGMYGTIEDRCPKHGKASQ